jgi:hypothetical protein
LCGTSSILLFLNIILSFHPSLPTRIANPTVIRPASQSSIISLVIILHNNVCYTDYATRVPRPPKMIFAATQSWKARTGQPVYETSISTRHSNWPASRRVESNTMMPPVRRTATRRIIVDPLVRYLRVLYHDFTWLVFRGFTGPLWRTPAEQHKQWERTELAGWRLSRRAIAIAAIAFAVFKIVVGTVLWLFRAVFGW